MCIQIKLIYGNLLTLAFIFMVIRDLRHKWNKLIGTHSITKQNPVILGPINKNNTTLKLALPFSALGNMLINITQTIVTELYVPYALIASGGLRTALTDQY
jgi:hypothetical protein